jgi:hypothetical protein
MIFPYHYVSMNEGTLAPSLCGIISGDSPAFPMLYYSAIKLHVQPALNLYLSSKAVHY